jgi:hypothetical protein
MFLLCCGGSNSVITWNNAVIRASAMHGVVIRAPVIPKHSA